MGSLVDAILVYIYMKYVHQWKDILSSAEVLNSELESQMEESSFHATTEQSNDPPIEPPHSDPTIETSVTRIKNEAHVWLDIELATIEETNC